MFVLGRPQLRMFWLLLLFVLWPSVAWAALSPSLLIANGTDTDATSFNTANISPAANSLILLEVHSKDDGAAVTPTVTGCSMTWTQVATVSFNGGSSSVTLFRSLNASPGSACALTIDFSGSTQQEISWIIHQWDGVDTSGTNGSGAIVQSATNSSEGATTLSVTLAAFGDATNNAAAGFFGRNSAAVTTVGGGFTILGDFLPSARRASAEYKIGEDTGVDMSWGTSNAVGGVAVEIKAASGANIPRAMYQYRQRRQ